jgi:hypothetical protein
MASATSMTVQVGSRHLQAEFPPDADDVAYFDLSAEVIAIPYNIVMACRYDTAI